MSERRPEPLPSPTRRQKDAHAVQIGRRIAQARAMGGFATQADLTAALNERQPPAGDGHSPTWAASRLGGYEAGYAIPHPADLMLIAELTGCSVCWLAFGTGPIRNTARNLQAIRFQNFVHTIAHLRAQGEEVFLEVLGRSKLSSTVIERLLEEGGEIGTRIARQFERALGKRAGWFDEQHAEFDPLFESLPVGLRRVVELYSEATPEQREAIERVVAALVK